MNATDAVAERDDLRWRGTQLLWSYMDLDALFQGDRTAERREARDKAKVELFTWINALIDRAVPIGEPE